MEDLVTKSYLDDSLAAFRQEMNENFVSHRREIEAMLGRFAKMFVDELHKFRADLDNRMETGFSELRQDIKDVHRRIDVLESETNRMKIRIYNVENH